MSNPDKSYRPAPFPPGPFPTPQLDALLARRLPEPPVLAPSITPCVQQVPHGDSGHDLLVQCLVPNHPLTNLVYTRSASHSRRPLNAYQAVASHLDQTT